MNCKEIRKKLGPYLYGDLEPETMKEVRLHVQGCDDCREDLMSRNRVVAMLDPNVPELSDEERSKLARNVHLAVEREKQPDRRAPRSYSWAYALGLGALLVAGFMGGRLLGSIASPHAPLSLSPTHTQSAGSTNTSEPDTRPVADNPTEGENNKPTDIESVASENPVSEDKAITEDRLSEIIRRSLITATATHREGRPEAKDRPVTAPEGPLTIIATPEETSKETTSNETRLPEPTGINDATTFEGAGPQ